MVCQVWYAWVIEKTIQDWEVLARIVRKCSIVHAPLAATEWEISITAIPI